MYRDRVVSALKVAPPRRGRDALVTAGKMPALHGHVLEWLNLLAAELPAAGIGN
jgi:hypothetical protein